MDKMFFDVGRVHDQSVEAWFNLIKTGHDFSISDALGLESTYAVLSSPLIGDIPIVGAIEGTARALQRFAHNPLKTLESPLFEPNDYPEFTIRTLELRFALEQIIEAIRALEITSSPDPMAGIADKVADWVSNTKDSTSIEVRARLLVAITIIGLTVRYPNQNSRFLELQLLRELQEEIAVIRQTGQETQSAVDSLKHQVDELSQASNKFSWSNFVIVSVGTVASILTIIAFVKDWN